MANEKQSVEHSQDAPLTAEEIRQNNLRFYSQGCEVPADALKKIMAGRIKGMSDVNPMWRMKRMTEVFGPVGFGWRYEIEKFWTETYGNEVKCFCNVNLYVRDPETKEWSAAIPGNGGSSIVSAERQGIYVNDEGYKMALTDALSIAMKPLGIGGNVWYGPKATGHNESKYEASTMPQTPQSNKVAASVFNGNMLKSALDELDKCTTTEHISALWNKWSTASPALCAKGGEFYQAVSAKSHSINNAAQ